jgi:F0F1-type ATP synthase assembly protein I
MELAQWAKPSKILKKNKQIDKRNVGKYLTLPFQMLAIIGLGAFGGIKLDKALNFEFPIFTLLFTIIAVVLAIYYVIKDLIK